MIPPGSIPPMERPKEASILVAQYLEEFLGKFLEDFWMWGNSWRIFGGGEILGGSAGSAGRAERGRLGYEYTVHPLKFCHCTIYIVHLYAVH